MFGGILRRDHLYSNEGLSFSQARSNVTSRGRSLLLVGEETFAGATLWAGSLLGTENIFYWGPRSADPVYDSCQDACYYPRIHARNPLSHNHNIQASTTGDQGEVASVSYGGRILRKAIKGATKEGKRVWQKDTKKLTKRNSRGYSCWNLGKIQRDYITLEIVIEPQDWWQHFSKVNPDCWF